MDLNEQAAPDSEQGLSNSGADAVQATVIAKSNRRLKRWDLILPIVSLIAIAILAGIVWNVWNIQKRNQAQTTAKPQSVNLNGISPATSSFQVSESNKVIINGLLSANQGLVLQPTDEPTTPQVGQIYIDSDSGELRYYNGEDFVALTGEVGQGDTNITNNITEVTQVTNVNNVSNIGVDSLQGLSGALTISSSNGLTVSSAGSDVQIDLPQDISAAASPTFAGLTLNGNVDLNNDLTVAGTSDFDGDVNLNSNVTITGGSLVFDNAGGNTLQSTSGQDLTIDAGSDDLIFVSGGRTFILPTTGPGSQTICTTGIICAAGGGQAVLLAPGSAQTNASSDPADSSIFINNTGTSNLVQLQGNGSDVFTVSAAGNTFIAGALTVNTITPSAPLTIGATGQSFTLQGNSGSAIAVTGGGFDTTVGFTGSPVGDVTYNFDRSPAAGAYQICTTAGNCAGVGGSVTTAGGTNGTIAMFTGTSSIANSVITQSGSIITIAGSEVIQGSNSLTLGTAATNTGSIAFKNSTNSNTLTLQSGATGSNFSLTLPTTTGVSGQCLSTSGATGLLGWVNCLSGSGTGGGVTDLDGLSGSLTIANTSGVGALITIDNAQADGATLGIAAFDSTNFSDNGSGVINTIQDIDTSASPTFAGLSTSGSGGAVFTLQGASTSSIVATSGVNSTTLSFGSIGAVRTLTLPNETGTLCTTAGSAACTSVYGTASGSGNYIQNQFASPQTADFLISGTGQANTAILTPTVDTATATTLNIGTTTASNIMIGSTSPTQMTTIRGPAGINIGTGLTQQVNIQTASNLATAFQLQDEDGVQILAAGTLPTPNLIDGGNFELSSEVSNWSPRVGATLIRSTAQKYLGASSMKVTTSAATGSGASYTYSFVDGTQYYMTFFARLGSGTFSDFRFGHVDGGTDVDCEIPILFFPIYDWDMSNDGWQKYTCTFTASSTTALYIKQNSTATVKDIYIDNFSMQASGTGTHSAASGTISFNGQITSPLLIQPLEDSESAFHVMASNGYNLFDVDTLNQNVQVTSSLGNALSVLSYGGNGISAVSADSNSYGLSASGFLFGGGVYGEGYTLPGVYGRGHTNVASGLFQNVDAGNTSATLITKAVGSQTSDLFQAQNSSGSRLFSVDISGNLWFSTDTSPSTAHTITVATQTASNTAGKNLTITSGAGNGSGNGGTLTLQTGSGGGTNGAEGGDMLFTASNGTGIGAGGTISLSAGSAGSIGGGEISVLGGTALGGGSVNISAGESAANSPGAVVITGGDATSGTDSGGGVFLVGGNATGTGSKGDVYLQSVLGTDWGNVGIGGLATATARLHVSSSTASLDLFKVSDSTSTAQDVLTIADGGATTFRNQTNSTSAFRIQNTAGNNIFTVETSSPVLRLGATSTQSLSSTIHISDTSDGTGTQAVTIGSTANAANTVTIQGGSNSGSIALQSAGGVSISALGTANSTTYLCRNGSNIISTCQTNATGTAFIQGGNSFGATGTLGTNDGNSLAFETNNVTRLTLDTSGNITIAAATSGGPITHTLSVGTAAASTAGDHLTIAAGAGNGSGSAGGNLTLQAGAAGSGTASGGSVTISATAASGLGNGGVLTLNGGSASGSTAGNLSFSAATFLTTSAISLTGASSTNAGITGGPITIAGGANTSASGTVAGGSVTIQGGAASGGSSTGNGGAVSIQGGTSVGGTTGTIGIGDVTASALSIGNTTASTTTLIQGGTGASAIQLVPGAAGAILIGGTTQTGTITVGRSTSTNTVSIGSAAGNGATQTVNIGTSATAGSTTNVNIGSTIGGYTVIQSVNGLVVGNGSSSASPATGFISATNSSSAGVAGAGLVIGAGQGSTTGGGGAITLQAGNAGATANGGDVNIRGGGGGATSGNGGSVSIQGGTVTSGTTGAINIGTTTASAINIGATTNGLLTLSANSSGILVRPAATTTAFQIQNASNNELFTADTSNNRIVLGKASTLSGALRFMSSAGSGSITLTPANPGSSTYSITLPGENGTVCLQNSVSCGFLSAGSTFTQGGNSFGTTAVLGTADNNDLEFVTNGVSVFMLDTSGAATLQNSTNSTNAFRVLDDSNNPIFNVDTVNGQIGILTDAPSYTLGFGAGTGPYSIGVEDQTIVDGSGDGLSLQAGMGNGIGQGGNAGIVGGNGGVDGDGGNVVIVAGNSGSGGDLNGGNIILSPGTGNGAGLSGGVIVQPQLDSPIAFVVQTAANDVLFGVDTTGNGAISIQTNTNGTIDIGTANITNVTIGDSGGGGTLTVNGDTTIFGTLSINGHVLSANESGTTTIAAGAAACTSPTVSVAGNDTAGTITITTGTGCASGGVMGTVTFANAYGAAPRVVLTPAETNAATLQYYNGSVNTTTFTLNTNTTATNTTTYKYNYLIVQ